MGIFDSIKSALGFDTKEETTAQQENTQEVQEVVETTEETTTPEVQITTVEATVDIVAILDDKSNNHPENLNWKNSIVDLMKLLDIDSSYAHRKELANELGIEGYEGTAEQNIALHKAVLTKLAANGGNVPSELLA